jgi:predicted DNA-binding WGR domain protein
VSQGTTYLELSEDSGSAHKFYEVIVSGSAVSVRYGRMGTEGQLQTSSFPTPDKARAAAAKKIGEKVRKGYAPAPGGRYVVAGDSSSSVYCFAPDGARLWKLGTGCGCALSMQYRDEKLYIVATDGSLTCIDATDQAIAAAQGGTVPIALDVKLAAAMPTYVPTVEAAGYWKQDMAGIRLGRDGKVKCRYIQG